MHQKSDKVGSKLGQANREKYYNLQGYFPRHATDYLDQHKGSTNSNAFLLRCVSPKNLETSDQWPKDTDNDSRKKHQKLSKI